MPNSLKKASIWYKIKDIVILEAVILEYRWFG